MSNTTENAFVAVELVSIDAKKVLCLEPRAAALPLPAVFYSDKAIDDSVLSGKRDKKDFEKQHQVFPHIVSSMAATMPNIQRAREKGNPYVALSKDFTPDTKDKYKAHQPLLPLIWETLAKAKVPMTAKEISDVVLKKVPDAAKLKYVDYTFWNTLRDLSLYGLAKRDQVNVRFATTRFVAVDPKDVKLLNEQ